jgi:hypothetical protein
VGIPFAPNKWWPHAATFLSNGSSIGGDLKGAGLLLENLLKPTILVSSWGVIPTNLIGKLGFDAPVRYCVFFNIGLLLLKSPQSLPDGFNGFVSDDINCSVSGSDELLFFWPLLSDFFNILFLRCSADGLSIDSADNDPRLPLRPAI